MINNFKSGTGFGNKPENIINDITAKLASKTAKGKSKKLNSNVSSDDSNLDQKNLKQNLSEFGKLMLHSDETALSSAKKELKAKSSLLHTQINKNVSISEKPLSEINNLIGELSILFESKPEPKVQFADAQTEDKFLDLIIENFEDLLTSDTDKISEVYQQAISKEGLNAISSSENINNSEVEEIEFSSDYDILNPLNGLEISDLQNLGLKVSNETPAQNLSENKKNKSNSNVSEIESFIQNELSAIDLDDTKSQTKSDKVESEINPYLVKTNNAKDNKNVSEKSSEIELFIKSELETLDNVVSIENTTEISTDPNVNNIKYKLKDLIGIIRQAMKSEVEEGNELFNGNLKIVINNDLKEPNYLKDSESRISSMVEKNTRNLVDNFLPKYFYKGINNLKNISTENNPNTLGKTFNDFISENKFANKSESAIYEKVYNFGEKLESVNSDTYIKELNNLESKLSNKDISGKNLKDNSIFSEKTNISTKSDEKYNIKPSVEIEPTIETKANKITETIEDVKKINDVKSENNLNNLVNLNQNNTEIKKSENIINRSNSLEFQTFNDIKTDELVETTAKATLSTNIGNTSMVRITMNPTDLGTVFVEIKMNGDNAELNFKASDKDVISTLENNIAELQESLRKENVEIKSLIIDYKNFSEELNKDGQNKQNNDNNQQSRNNQNKSLFKDLQDVELEQKGISLDKSFYENLKNFAGSIREESPIYKEVGKMGNNLETIKIKSKVIEKYM